MISSVLSSPMFWGIVATGATDMITRVGLRRFGFKDSPIIRSFTVISLNLALLLSTESYTMFIPGLLFGFTIQLKALIEIKAKYAALKEKVESLEIENENKSTLEAQLKGGLSLISALEEAIKESEDRLLTT